MYRPFVDFPAMFRRMFDRPRSASRRRSKTGSMYRQLGFDALEGRDLLAAGIFVSPLAGLNTSETGGAAVISVKLNEAPTADVTIGVASDNPDEGVADKSALVFTPANWNVIQKVRVTGQADGVVDGNKVYHLVTAPAVSADLNYNGIDAPDATLTNRDNPRFIAGVVVKRIDSQSTEDGGTAAFTIRLNVKPTADVTISLATDNPAEGIPNVGSVTFTADNWNQPQTVLVTGQPDGVRDGTQRYNIITGSAVSADARFNGKDVADVALTNRDSRTLVAGITVTPTSGLVTDEMGGIANFTVVLNYRPTANVVIPLSSSNPAEGVPHVGALTFTPTNWNTPQQVMVLGQDDGIFDGDVRYTIITGPAQSADPLYNGMDGRDVSVTNRKNTDVSRFDGVYTGTFSGSVYIVDDGRYPASGTVTVVINNGALNVTVNVAGEGTSTGTGTLTSTGGLGFGLTSGSVAGATFAGTFSTIANTNKATARGTWRLNVPGVVSGSGSWNIAN